MEPVKKEIDTLSQAVTFCKLHELTKLSFERYDRGFSTLVSISYEQEENEEVESEENE